MTANVSRRARLASVVKAKTRRSRFGASTKAVMEPGFATAVAETSPFKKKVSPLRNGAAQVDLPNGSPVENLHLANGRPIEQDITLTINTTGVGTALNLVNIVLFDESGFHSAASPYNNPTNSVYIGSATNNKYLPWLSGTCGETKFYDSVLIHVTPAAGAAATAQNQFQNDIVRWDYNVRGGSFEEIPISNYVEPEWDNQNVRVIALDDINQRIDRSVAWVYPVYEGMIVNMTFRTLATLYGR